MLELNRLFCIKPLQEELERDAQKYINQVALVA